MGPPTLVFFCALIISGVICQPTADSWRREFQRTTEEQEFCFGFYCNRSERVCGKKSFDCLAVFPEDSTDENKTVLCLDLIEKGDKSVLPLEGSIDVCRYRFGKNRYKQSDCQNMGYVAWLVPFFVLLFFFNGVVLVLVAIGVITIKVSLPRWKKNSYGSVPRNELEVIVERQASEAPERSLSQDNPATDDLNEGANDSNEPLLSQNNPATDDLNAGANDSNAESSQSTNDISLSEWPRQRKVPSKSAPPKVLQ